MITPLMLMLASYVAAAAPSQVQGADAAPAGDDRTVMPRVQTPGASIEDRIEPAVSPAPGLPLAGLTDEQVLAAAAASLDAIDTMQARFVQTAPSGEVSTGRAYMDRPGRLRFDYDAPSAQAVLATNGLVYVTDTDLETTDSYPVSKTPLRFLLGREVETEDAVLTGVERAPGEVAVTLEAADTDLSGQVALVFDVAPAGAAPGADEGDEALTLSRWALFDPRGGVTVVALEDPVFGEKLPRRLFRAPRTEDRFLDRR